MGHQALALLQPDFDAVVWEYKIRSLCFWK